MRRGKYQKDSSVLLSVLCVNSASLRALAAVSRFHQNLPPRRKGRREGLFKPGHYRKALAIPERSRIFSALLKKKNPAAVALGRKGGLKGGEARAEKLSQEELSEQGRNAVKAR